MERTELCGCPCRASSCAADLRQILDVEQGRLGIGN